MKKLMTTAAALMIAVAAYGQGQFIFNTHDTSAGNVLTFVDQNGAKIAGPNYFVDVLVGTTAANVAALVGDAGGPFVINRTLSSGAASGFTNPFSQIYTVPGQKANSQVFVGYRAYQGSSYDAATIKSATTVLPSAYTLTEPPTPPGEVPVGTVTVTLTGGGNVPEPATWALGLLGFGALLAIRRRS